VQLLFKEDRTGADTKRSAENWLGILSVITD